MADVITDVSGLIGIATTVLVPAVGGLVLAIVNFINHHTNKSSIKDTTAKVAAVEGKIEDIAKQVNEHGTQIAVAVDAVPEVKDAVATHEAQINQVESKIASLVDEINKLKAAVPTS